MTFVPFPIYDFRSGLDLSVAPWKIPAEAFTSLSNMMLRRGIVRKRSGQSIFGQIGKFISAETGFANPAGNQYTITLASMPSIAIPHSIKVYDDGGVQVLRDNGVYPIGTFTGDGTGTINYATGAIDVTFTGAIVGNVDVDYHYEDSEDVRGINEFKRYTGSNVLISHGTTRMSKFNTTYNYFDNVPAEGGINYDLWTGTNLMWYHAYNDKLWMTDNETYNTSGAFPVNGIRYYDGTVIRDPIADDNTLQYDTNANDRYVAALIVFTWHGRVILLNVKEGASATHYPQRMAWCFKGDPLAVNAWRRENAGNGNFEDADTNDEIVDFAFFGGLPVIAFEHSIWTIDYTGDGNDTFRWRRIAGKQDVSTTHCGIEYVDSAAFLGGKGLISTNGSPGCTGNFDKVIPDFAYEMDLDNISKACAGIADDFDQVWYAYPKAPNTATNNSVLVYNYEDRAFFKYDLSCYSFGTWIAGSDKTFEDYSGYTIASLAGVKWGDRQMQAGYPILLSGHENGYIYHVNDEDANLDSTTWGVDGTNINFELQTGRLNPFIKKGVEVQIQQAGFFVTRLTNAEFTVDFYVDEDVEPIYTQTIDCSTGTGEKVWVFADCVASGEFIKMKIYMTETQLADSNIPLQQIEIHGVLLWMQEGSRIKQ